MEACVEQSGDPSACNVGGNEQFAITIFGAGFHVTGSVDYHVAVSQLLVLRAVVADHAVMRVETQRVA